MNDTIFDAIPKTLEAIERDTRNSGFTMPSERKTGSLLRTLASAKPGGRFLELGTGTGLSTAWLLSGMDRSSELDSVENDSGPLEIARRHLDGDRRVRFHLCDGTYFIREAEAGCYDLIFADAWPGKYNLLDETLSLLSTGGFYVIDDMLPQPNWPEGHADKADHLLEVLDEYKQLNVTRMAWATGIVVCSKTD